MDVDGFDRLAVALGETTARRRTALRLLAGGALGGLLGAAPGASYARELGKPSLKSGEDVKRESGTVNGESVDRYTWRDGQGRPRSASLVRYGRNGGGYAAQFTYEVKAGGDRWQLHTVDMPRSGGDAGFGYFVSHELYRTFDRNICPDGGDYCPIAHAHGQDDSPLARNLPGRGRTVSVSDTRAVHEFSLNYPHWGTRTPLRDPNDTAPGSFGQHQKYDLPVTIRWTFERGKDYPLWSVTYDLSRIKANTVSADMRGPYGVMIFDGQDGRLTRLEWADERKFAIRGNSVSTRSEWTWNTKNSGARYNLLVAGDYKMGIVEAIPYARSRTGSTWSPPRGKTSANHGGCQDPNWTMPCDWQWPYQSIQCEAFDASPSSAKKIAWGTAAYVGTAKNFDDIGEPFDGYPKVAYSVWITFDKSGGAKARNLAAAIK